VHVQDVFVITGICYACRLAEPERSRLQERQEEEEVQGRPSRVGPVSGTAEHIWGILQGWFSLNGWYVL